METKRDHPMAIVHCALLGLLLLFSAFMPNPGEPAYLGVTCDKNPSGKGIVIREAASSTPAEKAGLKKGDIVESIDGKEINSPDDLRKIVGEKSADDSISLSVKRGNEKLKIGVKLGRRPQREAAQPPRKNGGIPEYLAAQEQKLQSIVDGMAKVERAPFEEILRKCRAATVRIRIGSGGGSGVIVSEGKYLATVGHNMRGEVAVGGEFTFILTDGRKFKAKVLKYSYKEGSWSVRKRVPDFVIAEIANPKKETLPSLDLGDPEEKGLAVLFGYPLMHGKNGKGKLIWIPAEDFGGYTPLMIPAKTLGKESGIPDMLNVAIDVVETLEGASGGPAVNRRGEIIGLIRSGDNGEVNLTHADAIRRSLKEIAEGK